MPKLKYKPVILVILDGWGVAPDSPGNAITRAKLPNFKKYISTYPAMTLMASGDSVGLPWGEIGNSEVGHTNLGSGFIFYQTCPRITKTIADGSFYKNEAFIKAIEHAKKNKSKLHLMGLISSGGVHSHIEHLYALLELAKKEKIKQVYIHGFMDGRDTIYNSGKKFIEELLAKIKEIGIDAKIASLSGRFYAMDRDNHWERTEKAFKAMVLGESENKFSDPIKAIEMSYESKIYDEEFVPTVLMAKDQPIAKIENKDAVIFFNFRSDRARQISESFVLPEFNKFDRKIDFKNLFFCAMYLYDKDLPLDAVAFFPFEINMPLAKVISDAKLKQLHIAETEKYAHVTYFFNGGMENPFPGEDRIVIPSPRVSSFAEKPEMSALKVTDEVIKAITENKYDFIVINFANADIVGHTADLKATIKAAETVDKCLGKIVTLALSKNGVVLVTSDHGNAEELQNIKTSEIDKEHSTNTVPFFIIGNEWEGKNIGLPDTVGGDLSLVQPSGILADVAPTVLNIMGVKKPEEMTGASLI
ncbi:MAG: 2,3-bisphosphoglycerate-independent phosphoglycerate mutase [Candidatus Parcubacteria bacterium]|nr:2,3-bisphosphoglycerate-independent phosphoglycerate mutase [Candidatus Parcubacteria bacterium]